MGIAVYPGTFDPITNGHVDVIDRASKLFEKVIVVIAVNSKKVNLFTVEERIEMVSESLKHLSNVEVEFNSGLIVDFAANKKANVLIRGIRSVTDFDYEMQIAFVNRKIQAEIQTIFMMPAEKYAYLNSSIIREISSLGQDVSDLVPPIVQTKLKNKFSHD